MPHASESSRNARSNQRPASERLRFNQLDGHPIVGIRTDRDKSWLVKEFGHSEATIPGFPNVFVVFCPQTGYTGRRFVVGYLA
jgi:hypothetical protein